MTKGKTMSSNFGFTSFSNLGSIVQQVQQVASQVSTHNIIFVNSLEIRNSDNHKKLNYPFAIILS